MKRKAQELETLEQESDTSDDSLNLSNSDSDPGSSGASDSESESDPEQEVNVDFEFFDPQEIDFHGLRALLQTYLDGTAYDCSQLVDTVIKQVYISPRACLPH